MFVCLIARLADTQLDYFVRGPLIGSWHASDFSRWSIRVPIMCLDTQIWSVRVFIEWLDTQLECSVCPLIRWHPSYHSIADACYHRGRQNLSHPTVEVAVVELTNSVPGRMSSSREELPVNEVISRVCICFLALRCTEAWSGCANERLLRSHFSGEMLSSSYM